MLSVVCDNYGYAIGTEMCSLVIKKKDIFFLDKDQVKCYKTNMSLSKHNIVWKHFGIKCFHRLLLNLCTPFCCSENRNSPLSGLIEILKMSNLNETQPQLAHMLAS